MTRTRATAKQAGTSFERLVADYLKEHVDDRIDRRVKTGALDKGDIAGLRIAPWGHSWEQPCKIVAECKNETSMHVGPWIKEAETERINDGAFIGIVVHKRHGHGAAGAQLVTMTLADLVALLTGRRPT